MQYELRLQDRQGLHDVDGVDGVEITFVLRREGKYWQLFSAQALRPALAAIRNFDNEANLRFWDRFAEEGSRLVEEFVRHHGAELEDRTGDERVSPVVVHPDVERVLATLDDDPDIFPPGASVRIFDA